MECGGLVLVLILRTSNQEVRDPDFVAPGVLEQDKITLHSTNNKNCG